MTGGGGGALGGEGGVMGGGRSPTSGQCDGCAGVPTLSHSSWG